MVPRRIANDVECPGDIAGFGLMAVVAHVVVHPALLAGYRVGVKLRDATGQVIANGIE